MRAICRGFLFLTLLTLASNLLAQQSSTTVPNLIRYGGVLKDAQGTAMSSRPVGITFLIYGQQDGGTPVWLETQNVTLDAAGHYSVVLGSTRAEGLPADLFSVQEERWLGVQVQGQPEQPRVLLVSVPYAMKAGESDRLSGHSVSEFVTMDNLQSAVQQLQGQATAVGTGTAAGTNSKSMAAGNPPVPTNTATNFVDTTTNQVVLVQQNGTGIGLKASSPGNVGVLGTVSSTARAGVVAGVEGTSSVTNGFGLFGYSSAATGGIGANGRSDSSNGVGLQGVAIGTGGIAVNAVETSTSGSPTGVVAKVSAPTATGALITNVATGTVTGPLISATTNAGTQFTVGGNGNVTAAGSLSGKRLMSTVATGTAPLQVASTTLVPNLNASLLGGKAASAFALASGSPNYIQNGTAVQPSANFNISGTGTANKFNSVTSYQIGGSSVLSIGSAADNNLFLGVGAGSSNVAGSGTGNTFSGYQAGFSNSTGSGNTFSGYLAGYSNIDGGSNTFYGSAAGYNNTSGVINTFYGSSAGSNNKTGYYNTFSGAQAGYSNIDGHDNTFSGTLAGTSNTTGNYNTFSGSFAGVKNTGDSNTFSGYKAGYSNNTGTYNTFSGYQAGLNNDNGGYNTFSGLQAGYSNIDGNYNAFYGAGAGYYNNHGFQNTFSGGFAGFNDTYGYNNTFIGYAAGVNNTLGNYDVYIANQGPQFSEDYTIRIGDPNYQHAAYIAGIYGVNSVGVPVYINSSGLLGTTTSSRRFKEQVRDMGDSTNALMKLRPVTFLYKPEYDKGPRTLQYGLIAEEVAELYPDLVAYEPDGKPYTVKYQYLTTMLLNEVQKQYHRAEAQAEVIQVQQQDMRAQTEVMKAQQLEIEGLKAQLRLQNAALQERLLRLESMAGTQTQIAADLPPR